MTTQHDAAAAISRDALAERLFSAMISTLDLCALYLGDRLGYYRILADGEQLTSAELAARSQTVERYAREWLEQQAVTGILLADTQPDGALRRYHLPAGHAEVLTDTRSLSFVTPIVRLVLGSAMALPGVQHAFRHGGGVDYAAYGADILEGIGDGNRPQFEHLLGSQWFPAIPDLHARLLSEPPARVADIGCGAGWSSLAIARAYPLAQVVGLDLDEASVAAARVNAEEAGLEDRVRFQAGDAVAITDDGSYDLVCAFECLHDMADPVGALRKMRQLAGETGTVLIVDERTPDAFAAPGDDLDRFFYGISIVHCLPVGMADQPSAGTGTVMRTATLRGYAQEGGFQDVTVLPIDNDFWRFYGLTP